MYTSGKLESVFIEIICPNSSYLIIGSIYKHPMLHIGYFKRNYISIFFFCTNFQKDPLNKYFLGEFNTDLFKYESSKLVNSFLDILSSHFLKPQIILPTRIFKYEPSKFVNSFLDTLSSNSLKPQIILPTRISSSSNSSNR